MDSMRVGRLKPYLVSTGEFRRREDYYDGTSVRVSVDGQPLP